jgi:HK97 family phage prohead protease
MKGLKFITVPLLEVKALGKESAPGDFEGYASTYGNVDFGGDRVMPGAFDKSIEEHKTNGSMPGLFWQHNWENPIGEWKAIESNNKGLKKTGSIWIGEGIKEAQQAHLMLKSKGPKGLSIGYTIDRADPRDDKGIRNLHELKLMETSIVTWPMNDRAKITAVKSDGSVLTKREVEEALRDAGFSSAEAKALLSGGYEALIAGNRDGSTEIDAALKELSSTINKITTKG